MSAGSAIKRFASKLLRRGGYVIARVPGERAAARRVTTTSASLGDAVAAFRNNGYAIARGVLSADWVTEYRDLVAAWFDELDRRVARGERNASLDAFSRQSGISLGLRSDIESMPPPGIRDFLGRLYSGGLWSAGFCDEELGALIEACSIRRQKPHAFDRALAYHQDSAVIGGSNGVVFWIPLDSIDSDTPGLEIVPQWRRPLPHTIKTQNAYMESIEPIEQESFYRADGAWRRAESFRCQSRIVRCSRRE